MRINLHKVNANATSGEVLRQKYDNLDNAGILNLVEMAKRGDMRDESRIEMAVTIAAERGLVTIEE